jgi:pyruvate/2-oxoglutarate dehydrogenase complex dihydrolipoamide dehydrogenase (E3) component
MGARVVLIEGHKMGGDCLNYGCVPSKALLAAGKAAQALRKGGRFGVGAVPAVDFAAAQDHVAATIAAIAPHDSVSSGFTGLGVQVIQDYGVSFRLTTVVEAGRHITARRFVIATGSTALIPPFRDWKRCPI